MPSSWRHTGRLTTGWPLFCVLLTLLWLLPQSANSADRYQEVMSAIEQMASEPQVRVVSIGRSVQGRLLPAVLLGDADAATRVLVLAYQHGDEPDGPEGLLSWLRLAAAGQIPLRSDVLISALPVVNPDGVVQQKRVNGAGVDLNRDWGTLSQPETQATMRYIERFRPHLVLDLHQWQPGEERRGNSVEAAQYVASRWEAVHCGLVAALAKPGLRVARVTSGPARTSGLMHRRLAAMQIPAFLVETSPAETSQRRQSGYWHLLRAVSDPGGISLQALASPRAPLELDLEALYAPPPPPVAAPAAVPPAAPKPALPWPAAVTLVALLVLHAVQWLKARPSPQQYRPLMPRMPSHSVRTARTLSERLALRRTRAQASCAVSSCRRSSSASSSRMPRETGFCAAGFSRRPSVRPSPSSVATGRGALARSH